MAKRSLTRMLLLILLLVAAGLRFYGLNWGAARDAWLAGASGGLALSTKISTALLLIPLGTACALRADERERHFWRCGLAALMAFALTNPFALLALPTFWRNVAKQATIVRGVLDVPYTRQHHGTWPYLYPIVQQMRWGMGWALGLAAFGGLIYTVWMAAGPSAMQEPPRRAEWVLLAWGLPAFVGALYAKQPTHPTSLTTVGQVDRGSPTASLHSTNFPSSLRISRTG